MELDLKTIIIVEKTIDGLLNNHCGIDSVSKEWEGLYLASNTVRELINKELHSIPGNYLTELVVYEQNEEIRKLYMREISKRLNKKSSESGE